MGGPSGKNATPLRDAALSLVQLWRLAGLSPGQAVRRSMVAVADEIERRVLFVCTHNAGRSIIAAALLNAHQPPGLRADSAGTDPANALNPTVVTALAERGISLTGVTPKPITSELLTTADW
jgi:hypothetical protein